MLYLVFVKRSYGKWLGPGSEKVFPKNHFIPLIWFAVADERGHRRALFWIGFPHGFAGNFSHPLLSISDHDIGPSSPLSLSHLERLNAYLATMISDDHPLTIY